MKTNKGRTTKMESMFKNDVDPLLQVFMLQVIIQPNDRIFKTDSYPSVVGQVGVEPTRPGFSVQCSTY